jgi:hypothetical protein
MQRNGSWTLSLAGSAPAADGARVSSLFRCAIHDTNFKLTGAAIAREKNPVWITRAGNLCVLSDHIP